MSEWSTEWRLYRARYTQADVTEDYCARSLAEVEAVRVDLVGPDEEAPDVVTEYDPADVVTLRDDDETGARLTFTADEWAASCAKPTCISSSEA